MTMCWGDLVILAAGFVLGWGVGLGTGLWTCGKTKADDR